MTVRTIDDIFRDFTIDGVPSSGPFNPHKPDIRDTLKKLLEGISTFPDNRVIRLNNANEGTANNIVVTASVSIPAAAYQVLYILNVTHENTGSVAVSGAINRTLVTNTSRPIDAGYLQPGMALLCVDTGAELRLLSYGDAEAILTATEKVLDDLIQRSVGAFASDNEAMEYLADRNLSASDGTIYFNTSGKVWKFFDGSNWQVFPYASVVDGAVTDTKIASPSLIANRRDGLCYITDYYGAAGGSVIGGNADRFTDAWNAAYADNAGKGTTVHIPKSPNGQDWLLNPVVMGDPDMNSQGKVTFKGAGRWTTIKPSGPMDNLIHQAASMNSIENLMIDDPASYLSGAAFRVTKKAMDGLPQYFSDIFGLGCRRLFWNDVADEGYYHNIESLNCRRVFDFNSGGVGARIDRIKIQGFEFGIILNSDLTTDPARIHSEELSITNYEMLGGSVWPNAIGVLALDSLLLRMNSGVIGQMGPDGKGLWLKGDIGNAYGRFTQCWFDVGAGGWGVYATDNNIGHQFYQCDVSYGGDGIADGSINGWYFEGSTDFLISGGRTADPTRVKFDNAALFINSTGTVRDVIWDSGGIGQNNSDIYWDSNYVPPLSGREITSSYVRNGWTPYQPIISTASGAIGSASLTGEYRRVGKTVTVRATATIQGNGTGAGWVGISLPVAAATGAKVWQGTGREDGISGNMLQSRVAGGTSVMAIQTYNNAYPGADNAVIQVELTYEC